MRYMLDTNMVRQAVTRRSVHVLDRLVRIPPASICVSVVTYAESMFGIRRFPEATKLAASNAAFYADTEILPFGEEAADTYGDLRAQMERLGKPLGPLDMLIAAHALAAGATLVSGDRAFRFVPGLAVEDWTQPFG